MLLQVNMTRIGNQFSKPTLTAKEFSILSGIPKAESENMLNEISNQRKIRKIDNKKWGDLDADKISFLIKTNFLT